jgi:hypothetical protein
MTPSLFYVGRALLTKLCRLARILAMESILCYASCALYDIYLHMHLTHLDMVRAMTCRVRS